MPRPEFVFLAEAGDLVHLVAAPSSASGLDYRLTILDPDNNTIAETDNDSLRGIRIEQDALHTIVIEAMQGEGDVYLSLSTSEPFFYIYTEDFEDNSSDWGIPNRPDNVYVDTSDGILTFGADTPRDDLGWFAMPGAENWRVAPSLGNEFYIEAEVSNLKTANGKYNIALYFAVTEDQASYRYWTINQDGYLQYIQKPDYVDMEIPTHEVFVPPVDFTDGVHTIGLYVINYESFVLSIDDQLVYTYTTNLIFEYTGTIGFAIFSEFEGGGEISASVDNVSIGVLRGETRAAVLTFDNGCMMYVSNNPSLIRSAPSNSAEVVESFNYAFNLRVIGQAHAEDTTWWQFGENRWGRDDQFGVVPESDCSHVPVVRR